MRSSSSQFSLRLLSVLQFQHCALFLPARLQAFEGAMESAIHFTRIILSSAWLIGAFVVFQNTLQAIGKATPALLASLFRQAILYIPIVFIFRSVIGMDGLLWAQPAADVLSLGIIAAMVMNSLKKE